MNLTVLGCSPSFPNPGGASSGYLLNSGDGSILVECGHGVVSKLLTVLDPRQMAAIIISHMHPDHYFDLIPLKYAFAFAYEGSNRIPLFLPPTGKVVLQRLQAAVGLADTFFGEAFEVAEYDPTRDMEVAGVTVAFSPTRHFVPGFAMRFTASRGGSSLAYSSDTGWSAAVLESLRGVSLALVEASVLAYSADESERGHLTPALAGELARKAGAERLLLTHYWQGSADLIRREASMAFGGAVELAEQGVTYPV